MLEAIAGTVPLGLGIALNPIAIVAGILLLATVDARPNTIAFLTGWVTGLSALLLLALVVHQGTASRTGEESSFVSALMLALGVILIGIAVRSIGLRHGDAGKLPRWMRLLDQIGTRRSLGLGLFLSTVSLKNIALLIAAATLLGQSNIDARGMLIGTLVFIAVCTIGILIPMLIHLFGGATGDARLTIWRAWLISNMSTITAVVLVLLGVHMIVQGARAFL